MKKDFMSSMREKTSTLPTSLLSTEENIKSQIQILDQLRDLIPPLSEEEYKQLQQNILKHGVKDPLTVWETTSTALHLDEENRPVYVLIDGHNRYRISQEYKLDYRLNLVRFAGLNEAKDYMIDFQLGRRNLSTPQIAYLRGLRYLQQKTIRGGNKLSTNSIVDVSVALGEEYGVSSRTIKRDGDFAAGLDKLNPLQKQEILTGKEKFARLSIEALAKTDLTKSNPAPDEVILPVKTSRNTVGENRVKKLEAIIRELAAGQLSRKSCERIVQKTNELLAILQAK
ncbi:ParB N-terminal domain-containing protein [Spirosoma utsteinense]|uniref:ParB N-terminal domain-containing protein n=1 Tax=Spirosoma utsteinense TaxID=2585773 RepID=UPI00164931B1|nr:ParB N-terminal domain-containing protein [Spirosoma utsteinense]MBC3787750.1 hypothetical protein [Spirosoma utsteinense]